MEYVAINIQTDAYDYDDKSLLGRRIVQLAAYGQSVDKRRISYQAQLVDTAEVGKKTRQALSLKQDTETVDFQEALSTLFDICEDRCVAAYSGYASAKILDAIADEWYGVFNGDVPSLGLISIMSQAQTLFGTSAAISMEQARSLTGIDRKAVGPGRTAALCRAIETFQLFRELWIPEQLTGGTPIVAAADGK